MKEKNAIGGIDLWGSVARVGVVASNDSVGVVSDPGEAATKEKTMTF